MPLGIVNDTDFDSELQNSDVNIGSVQNGPIVIDTPLGRGKGSIEVPDSLRKIIGEESILNGRASALSIARDFGISNSSVSAYAKGATSTATINKDRPNEDVIIAAKQKISVKARRRLHMALNAITTDALESAKVKDVASIAKDMSTIVKNMEPDKNDIPKGMTVNGPSIILYAPVIRPESDFEVIHINE